MGLSAGDARATLRLSLGWCSSGDDVERALEVIPPLVRRVRAAIPA
jgi:cysteine desulfurase